MSLLSRSLLFASLSTPFLLTGCATSFSPSPVQTSVTTMQGHVHGGQQAITSAKVYVLQASMTAYGGPGLAASTSNASQSLLTGTPNSDSIGGYVLTDMNGFFNLSSYTCTVGDIVYVYVLGGNPGSGTNSNVGLMAVLGTCPASGNFYTGATAISYVWVNEVTTVAAAYSLAGFATDATHIGTSGSALAQTGIQNAASTSGNLANLGTGAALATTPNGNGTVPQTEINTLANLLASCINENDGAYTNCTTLFGAATGASAGNATTPTDTATAAINLAHAPGTNIATLYALQSGIASPFLPDLTAQPNDFSVSLTFTGGGLTKLINSSSNFGLAPHPLTVDGSGNIWEAGYYGGNALSGFSPLGVPLASSGFTNSCLSYPSSATLDATSSNIWITNPLVSTTTADTMLCEYNIAGNSWTTVTPVSGTTSELNEPEDVSIDPSGNLFVASANNKSIVKLTSTGAFTSVTSNTTGVSYPFAIGMESSGNFWVAGQGSSTSKKYADLWTNANAYSLNSTTDYYFSGNVSIDSAGAAWVASNQTGMTKIPAAGGTGTQIAYTKQYALPYISSSVIDGGGNVWLSDYYNGLTIEYNNSGTLISGSHGYVPAGEPNNYLPPAAPITGYIQPAYVTVDGSGNVWSAILGVAELQEMVGAAVPVANPLSYAVANNLIGTRP